jgi:L-threonate 2-dehydrogenase
MARTPRIGVIGMGIMGGMMAEALCGAGYRVSGYDPTPAARVRFKRAGGTPLATSTAVAKTADVIILSLATAAALRDATEQIADAKRRKDAAPPIVIDTCTLSLADKDRARLRLKAVGITMLDCPISGTAVRMKEGSWTIFVSGDRAIAKTVAPLLAHFSPNTPYVGTFGNGTKMKFIANHLVAIYNVAYAETMTFARKMELDPQKVYDLFATTPVLGTGVFKLRGAMMVKRRYSPPTMKIEVWQKDMQVIGDMAKSLGCPTPLFTACAPIYTAAMGQGLALEDTASTCEVLGAMAGIAPKKPRRRQA